MYTSNWYLKEREITDPCLVLDDNARTQAQWQYGLTETEYQAWETYVVGDCSSSFHCFSLYEPPLGFTQLTARSQS